MERFVDGDGRRSLLWAAIGVMAVGLAATGCVEKSQDLTKEEQERLAAFVSQEPHAPGPDHELDVSLEGKVRLLGYSVEPAVWKEGEPLRVTWFWKAEQTLDKGWKLFTHVADANGQDRLNQDSTGVVRQLHPPGQWKKGQFIRDVQEMTLPVDWGSSRATLLVGLWNGPHRLRVTEGPHDGDNRIRVFSIRTEASPEARVQEAAAVPTLVASKTEGDISPDGKLDEAAWAEAKGTGRLVNTLDGSPAEPEASVKVLWSDSHLYVAFEVADDHLVSKFDKPDDHLWEQDAVEIMVDPTGDGKNYFEMQVSPKGVVFDTRYDSRRLPQPFGHVDWDSKLKAGVDVRGTVGDGQGDEGYTVEAAIPWEAFAAGSPPATRPSPGDTWRMNFYVMDAREKGQRAVGWSPTRTNDFHVPDRFGRVMFTDGSVNEGRKAPDPEAMKALRERLQKAAKAGAAKRQPAAQD
jgi:hypothetical protein